MRDILVVGIVMITAMIALRRPWIGVLLWVWISILNPHRFTYGFAYDFPVALIAAVSTLLGLLVTRERESPFKGVPPVLLAVFMVWITVSWLMGLSPGDDYPQWDKVMKILLMVLIGLSLLKTKQHIFAFAWVCAGSLALLGAKGGLFTITTGGTHRVWGPPGSFIEENNSMGLALVMTIPLLRFLQIQVQSVWGRRALGLTMILVAASALGSQSRGALLAIVAMTLVLAWRSRNRTLATVMLLVIGLALVAFMPDQWTARMSSIEDYNEDNSALGRFSAWWVAWGIGRNYPFGVGFDASRPFLFALYSPYPELGTPAAHSIYFQIMGNHGFVGLTIYLAFWVSTWHVASRIRKEAANIYECRWCYDLAGMSQVALSGYFVGGAFLSLSYFDLPYNIMALVVLTRMWMKRRAWESEPVIKPKWSTIPGLIGRPLTP